MFANNQSTILYYVVCDTFYKSKFNTVTQHDNKDFERAELDYRSAV